MTKAGQVTSGFGQEQITYVSLNKSGTIVVESIENPRNWTFPGPCHQFTSEKANIVHGP